VQRLWPWQEGGKKRGSAEDKLHHQRVENQGGGEQGNLLGMLHHLYYVIYFGGDLQNTKVKLGKTPR